MKQVETSYKSIITIALILLILLALQYYKPDFYWNSLKIKFQRGIIGDRIFDILVYGVLSINLLGAFFATIEKAYKTKERD